MTDRTSDSIIKRLLGPAEREVLCDECFEKLDQYVEVEMRGGPADEEIPGMRPHLDGCPACQEEYESLRDLLRSSDSSG